MLEHPDPDGEGERAAAVSTARLRCGGNRGPVVRAERTVVRTVLLLSRLSVAWMTGEGVLGL